MKLNKILAALLSCTLLLMMSLSAFAASGGGPTALLKGVADRMIADLEQHKVTLKSNRKYVYSLAYKLVVPHVDVDEMSRRVLPPQTWDKASVSQRAAFEHEFVELLVHTYASALASYTDQTVEFYPIRGGYDGKRTVEVNSQITSASGAPPVSVRYRLINKGGAWKLYDMSVEGVSVIESFRSQFADALSQGDIVALTKRLSAHNARPASSD
jgi:phospholipid transport system substrate-binding protein